jgi:hypothetical protein
VAYFIILLNGVTAIPLERKTTDLEYSPYKTNFGSGPPTFTLTLLLVVRRACVCKGNL